MYLIIWRLCECNAVNRINKIEGAKGGEGKGRRGEGKGRREKGGGEEENAPEQTDESLFFPYT